jgi:D-aminoacyl-tRNA deacylase
VIGLIQRVQRASVHVGAQLVGSIQHGLLVMVCAEPADTETTAAKLVDKILKLRIFADDEGKMNRSVQDARGGLLIVSQFTLAADTQRGNRPSFMGAAPPEQGNVLYEAVLRLAREKHATCGTVASGVFGADMQVALVNDGPVTIPMRVA